MLARQGFLRAHWWRSHWRFDLAPNVFASKWLGERKKRRRRVTDLPSRACAVWSLRLPLQAQGLLDELLLFQLMQLV